MFGRTCNRLQVLEFRKYSNYIHTATHKKMSQEHKQSTPQKKHASLGTNYTHTQTPIYTHELELNTK